MGNGDGSIKHLEYIDNEVMEGNSEWKIQEENFNGKDVLFEYCSPVTDAEIQVVKRKREGYEYICLWIIPTKTHMGDFHGMVMQKRYGKPSETWVIVDIEEMDINWQIAMIAIRMKKFYKKTGRRVRVDGKTPVGFDKKKLECFNCHNTGHFARECTAKGTHDGKKKRDSFYQHQEAGKQEKNQMGLLTMDDGIVNWGEHTEVEETNHALMAISSSNEVTLCSKTCIDSYNTLKTLCDEQMNQLGDQEAQILAYSQAVKKLEAQLVTFQKQQLSLNEKLTFQANEIYEKDEKLKRYRRIGMKAVKEKEQLQKTVDSWKDSSKNLWRLIDSGMSSSSKLGLGYEIKSNNEVLSYEEEMNFSVFKCSKEDSIGKPSYSRFTKTNDFKGVPHPLSGDYTPRPQEEIDDSLYVYGKKGPQKPEISVSDDNSSEHSTCQSNDSEGSCGNTSEHSFETAHSVDLNLSLSHLIKDCDYYEKKMARDAEVKKQRVVNTEKTLLQKLHAQKSHFHSAKGKLGISVKDLTVLIGGNFNPNSNCTVDPPLIRTENAKDRATEEHCNHKLSNFNVSWEKDKGCKLIVCLQAMRNTEEKAESRKSSTNSKKEEIFTELQQEKKASSTNTSEDNPKILAFRKDEPVNTSSFDPDDSPMPELKIFHKSETGILNEASYDKEGVITDFNSLSIEIEVSPTPTLRIHNIHPKSQILGDPKSAVQRSKEEGIDYDEVFAHVARIEAIRLFLAFASFMGFIVYQMDVKSAFLYGTIDEEIASKLLEAWDKKDIMLMSSMGELTFFLGLQVKQNKAGIFISQDKYVAEILKKFDLVNVKTAITPMETKVALTKDEEAVDVDVTPKTSHLNAVKRIFKYLKGKPHLGLWYPRELPFDLEAFSDSDYGGSNLDRKSTTGIAWICRCKAVGFLRKPDESAGFAEIVDFLRGSNLRNIKRSFRGAPRPLLSAMLLVATTNPNAGQAHPDVAPSQPSSSTILVPSTSLPPIQSPPPIPTPTLLSSTPTPIPETDPEPMEHTFEEPSPAHQHFLPPQEHAQE
ncbi:putative ribonuclease H-like domain-containing protein [Tanacetum coccineum]